MTLKLGFGTAPILGRIDKNRSLHALQLAHAAGIRHFDTARSYGWGECEGLLGRFLAQHRREELTLVSKCGLVPVPRSTFLSTAKKVGRQIVRTVPGSHRLVRRLASSVAPRDTYDVPTLRGSVEASLRELCTPYLDVLLLHNFEAGKEGFADVLAFFRELRERGTVRRFGVSLHGSLMPGLEFLRAQAALPEMVVQVPVSDALLELPDAWADVTFFVHSPFQYLQSSTSPKVANFESLVARLSTAVRCEALITSMFSTQHLRQNVETVARAASAVQASAMGAADQ
jgi:aryl-alcohol dehydrogenase-like predicted oxidoreductase